GSSEVETLAWLTKILLHQIADLRRRHLEAQARNISRETLLNDNAERRLDARRVVDELSSPLNQLVTAEYFGRLDAALSRLSEEYAKVIQYRSIDECSFEEVGLKLGCT